ncbi:hypothetical protein AVEN_104817-1 [Araneus ventricosus]|uniref:Uncharacterized protein n=1 Tax=Araneus ventricosus TaxID=182803 RepID=A0A4Y2IAW0_ARAVE|nr:hypothetical protein AVEN_104817-1 [Araneus ventricosus]
MSYLPPDTIEKSHVEMGHATNPVVPHILFGVLALLSGLLVLLLPETRDVTVPETLSEAASRRKPIKKKKEEHKEYEMTKLMNESGGKDSRRREGPEVIVQPRELRTQDKGLMNVAESGNRGDIPAENQQVSTVATNQEPSRK